MDNNNNNIAMDMNFLFLQATYLVHLGVLIIYIQKVHIGKRIDRIDQNHCPRSDEGPIKYSHPRIEQDAEEGEERNIARVSLFLYLLHYFAE